MLERTFFVIGMVLFGSSVVAFVIAPAIEALVRSLHRTSRKGGGRLGEVLFLAALGAGIFLPCTTWSTISRRAGAAACGAMEKLRGIGFPPRITRSLYG